MSASDISNINNLLNAFPKRYIKNQCLHNYKLFSIRERFVFRRGNIKELKFELFKALINYKPNCLFYNPDEFSHLSSCTPIYEQAQHTYSISNLRKLDFREITYQGFWVLYSSKIDTLDFSNLDAFSKNKMDKLIRTENFDFILVSFFDDVDWSLYLRKEQTRTVTI